MSCDVKGQILVDSAYGCDFLEVVVHLLIGRNREQSVVRGLICILLQYGSRNIEQGNIDRDFRLVATGVDPQPAVVAHNHFRLFQSPHVGVGEARKTTEHEDILYPL